MNSDRILKKTVFGGFKRADVLSYVEKLQGENVSLAQELRQKSTDASKLEEINDKFIRQSSEIENLRAKLSDTDGLNKILEEKIAALENEIGSLKNENSSLKEALSKKESELSDISREYAVFKNDKSNSLIQDAIKYSDSLVDTAKESANNTLIKAGDSINSVSIEIKTAGERVRTAQVNLDYSLSSIKSCVDELLQELENSAKRLIPGE